MKKLNRPLDILSFTLSTPFSLGSHELVPGFFQMKRSGEFQIQGGCSFSLHSFHQPVIELTPHESEVLIAFVFERCLEQGQWRESAI